MNQIYTVFVTIIALLGNDWLSSAETCTYTRTSDKMTGNFGSSFVGAHDIDECERLCTENSSCKAVHVKSNICYHSTNTNQNEDTGSTYSLKSCVSVTTAASVPTPTSVPSVGNCRKMNTKGGINYFAKLKVDDMSCRDLCRFLDDCMSVSYDGSQCKIFTTTPATTPLNGSKHAVKTPCITGHKCCLDVEQDATGSGSPAFVHSNTVDSCEQVCKLYSSCTGASWSGTECTLYTYNTTTAAETGTSYFDKSCLNGVGTGSSTFTRLCMSSTSGLKSGFLVFAILLVRMLCT